MNNLTYYDLLQISPDANDLEIRTAYIRLAKRHHPDANPHDRNLASARFRLIQDAYDHLRDGHKRRAYDDTLRANAWVARPQNDNVHAASDVFTRTRQTLERLMRLMSQSRDIGVNRSANRD